MTNERPLGVLSEEFARLREYFDERLDRTEDRLDRRLSQTEGRVEARFAEQGNDIKALTEQVKTTNGRVTTLERWKAEFTGFANGVKGSWGVAVAAASIGLAAGGLVATVVLSQ